MKIPLTGLLLLLILCTGIGTAPNTQLATEMSTSNTPIPNTKLLNETEPINPSFNTSLSETNNKENSILDVNEEEAYNLTKIRESWMSSFYNSGIYIIETEDAPSKYSGIFGFYIYYYNNTCPIITPVHDFTITAYFPISPRTIIKLNDCVNMSKYISIVIAMGIQNTGGYWVNVEGAWVEDNNITIKAKFETPGENVLVIMMVTQSIALIEIGNLASENEYYATIELNLEGTHWFYIH